MSSSKNYIVTAIVKIHLNDIDGQGALMQAMDLIKYDIEQGNDGIIEWQDFTGIEEVNI